ncbi:alpha-1-acid glycoprotein-like isoform X2 [Pipistrellus kuhlii]|uniref:alpha-1-acid glycoprotein-like isoform X2 n=1 Tax=Pipistrellus kuhlii TaxID=59472 RepID=UPI001E271149|nr:alpha-1-acid glycoprotein-like isoform X2 [Pipistrellus kuhlii]
MPPWTRSLASGFISPRLTASPSTRRKLVNSMLPSFTSPPTTWRTGYSSESTQRFRRGQCMYNSTNLRVNRENGTLTKHENGTDHFGHLLLPKDPKTFMLAFFPEDKQKMGLSFFADKPEVTPEQMEEFYDYLTCMGMDKSEVLFSDEKKNMCLQLEKQHDEERRKEKEKSETGSALD